MKLLFSIVFVFAFSHVNAQNRNSIWCFGDSAGIDFRNLANPVPIISSMDVRGASVTIADSLGNLQFYAASQSQSLQVMLWNSLHQPLFNAIDSFPSGGLYNDVQIIPMPGTNNKYYVFHTGFITGFTGLYYAIVNMDLDNGLGGVESKFHHITSDEMADCLQAIKHANGRDWWLIGKSTTDSQTRNNRFYVYLVTPAGISPVTIYDFNNINDIDFQKIIVSPDESKLMQITFLGFMCEYDFDRCNGLISNPRIIFPEAITGNRIFWEGAYSPSGNLFYMFTQRLNNTDTCYLVQYDLLDTNISLSADTLDRNTDNRDGGAIRLAPDNKIYYTNLYDSPIVYSYPYADSMYNYINMNLGVIQDPDQLGLACNFQPFSFYLGGKRTYYGLPSNPDYQLGPVIGSVCDSLLNSVDDRIVEKIDIEVFPNPFHKTITLQSENQIDEMVNVYNKLGDVIFSKQVLGNQSLNLDFLPSGNYVIEIIGSENVFRKRIVKLD